MEKTRQEVEDLKQRWFSDPTWDLDESDGFESHKQELREYMVKSQEEWNRKWLLQELSDRIEKIHKERIVLQACVAFIQKHRG